MSRLKGRPFEILAVSLDYTREELLHMLKNKTVPGIHTWDDRDAGNQIAKLYNVISLPTWYLLDKQGVIRARDSFGRELIPAVEAIIGPAPH